MNLFFIQQYIVPMTSQLLMKFRRHSQLVTDYFRKSSNECCTCRFIATKYWETFALGFPTYRPTTTTHPVPRNDPP